MQASRSRSNTCPNNEPCRVVREGLQPVCRSGPKGSNNGTNLKQNGTKSHDGRRFPLLCSHRQAPRGGEPTHQDRQHQGFQFLTLFFFQLRFYFLSSFIRKCFICFSSLASDYEKNNRLCSFDKACAGVQASGSVSSTDLKRICFFLETTITTDF